jgi:hypothetical protein
MEKIEAKCKLPAAMIYIGGTTSSPIIRLKKFSQSRALIILYVVLYKSEKK